MAVRVDHQYVHCCCVHSTHCEWRTIGPQVHITRERIKADRILPTHRPNTVVRHTKHQSSCHYQFLCVLCYTAWLWQKWIPQRVNPNRPGQWGAHIRAERAIALLIVMSSAGLGLSKAMLTQSWASDCWRRLCSSLSARSCIALTYSHGTLLLSHNKYLLTLRGSGYLDMTPQPNTEWGLLWLDIFPLQIKFIKQETYVSIALNENHIWNLLFARHIPERKKDSCRQKPEGRCQVSTGIAQVALKWSQNNPIYFMLRDEMHSMSIELQ